MSLDDFKSEDTNVEDKTLGQLSTTGAREKSKSGRSTNDDHHLDTYEPSEWLYSKFDEPELYITETKCPKCDNYFLRLGSHLFQSDCEYPQLEGEQMDLLRGLMMGDGSLSRQSNNPCVVWEMTNLPFMIWLRKQLGIFSKDVKFRMSAKESKNDMNLYDNKDLSNWRKYADSYRCRTMCHPSFTELDWYSENGQKKFPNNLTLNDLIVKIWYCADGSLSPRGGINSTIYACNESSRFGMLKLKFKEWGVNVDRVDKIRGEDGALCFNKDATSKLLSKMGPAVPGFEYKWCTESIEQYQKLKDLSRNTSKSHKQGKRKFIHFDCDSYKERALEIGGFGGY